MTTPGIAIKCGHDNKGLFVGVAGCSPLAVDPSPTPTSSFPLLLPTAFFFTSTACIGSRLGLFVVVLATTTTTTSSSLGCDLHRSQPIASLSTVDPQLLLRAKRIHRT
ncbi:hypothetical protein C4D60_Mb05t10250 [Musa balbisiana]|uniref:Uncharacterized protein n=1 Tax=Musa balbisiana TaxID=52838 RepID=A0A4S8JV25_MUSBA|nr:hypothetical protein C4D60_Mb05t10250 [Musa balbisiana]